MVAIPARTLVMVVVAEMVEDDGMAATRVSLTSVRKAIIEYAIAFSAG